MIKYLYSILLSWFFISVQAQKIKIDDSLKLHSSPMELKVKGISALLKYRFGDYAVASVKVGWGTSSTYGKLFSVNEVTESKSKYSFVFTSNDGDTAKVNAATNTVIDVVNYNNSPFKIGNADMISIAASKYNYFASIVGNKDTSIWTLVMIQAYGKGADPSRAYSFEGGLTNGETKYDLKMVDEWESGKTPMFGLGVPGYELKLNGQSVAAIQIPLNTMIKRYVWIDDRLDTSTRFLLAAALTAIAENVASLQQ